MSVRTAVCLLTSLLIAGAATAEPALDAEMKAVELIRGRKFTAPVRNVTIARSQLPGMLRKQIERDLPYSAETWVTVLRSLQLVDAPQQDVLPKLLELYQSQVLAFYDPAAGTYYTLREVPEVMKKAGSAELIATMVAVHELTHALQGQHFGIGRRIDGLRRNTDASMAYHSVIEGEALLVMFAHMLAKAGTDLESMVESDDAIELLVAAARQDQSIGPETPRYFAESLKFPYIDGLRLVIHAYRRDGWKGVDALHLQPPASTREVLHPEEYFARVAGKGQAAQPLWANPPSGVLASEHLGEFHWAFLLGESNATGLRQDRAIVLRGAKPTVLVETLWDTPEQAARFAGAYRAFLAGRGLKPLVVRDGMTVKAGYGANRIAIARFVPQEKKAAALMTPQRDAAIEASGVRAAR
ncbi:MAG: hypothetical protein WA208_21090 [Thermoanaerobaculia bacterium]